MHVLETIIVLCLAASGAACGVTALILYLQDRKMLRQYLPSIGNAAQALLSEKGRLGYEIAQAYPISDVAGAVNAIIEKQKPAITRYIADEGIPFLAAAGSKEVAANARGGKSQLAAAVGNLGSGADGLQGLAAIIAKPGKASGGGDLMAMANTPLGQMIIKQVMNPGTGGNGQPPSSPSQSSSPSLGGKLGGN